ncbi:hypothetical protein EON64_06700, partial [archaeon]
MASSVLLENLQGAKRELKRYFASDFEGLLLALTQPTSSAIDASLLNSFLATLNSFVLTDNVRDKHNPFVVTLRKLHAKCAEGSARTSLKTFFLLHTLCTSVQDDDLRIYRKILQQHKAGMRWFNLSRLRQKAERRW